MTEGDPAGGRKVAVKSPTKVWAGAKLRVTRTSVNGAPMPVTLNESASGIPAEPQIIESGICPTPVAANDCGTACDGIAANVTKPTAQATKKPM